MAKCYKAQWDDASKTWAVVETIENKIVSTGHTRTEAMNQAFSINDVREATLDDYHSRS